ncbi:TorF family putative porin [Thiothrix nivea]|uniref:Histidine kinase n=1 Tax=Thiothrix nivea (strain ATCC 35100 / DSM 5205 / JP2) TaxID=870187 RepID=A0A656HE31_THINJ|nr:TorF family putative porin [Thiothrix nivea]EIJ35158.1 hypothetical protein Thini_2618 [Thiothrix nivea DSM 5205]
MHKTNKILASSLATALFMALAAPAVHAEAKVSASAAVSNMYLWRGYNLGDGDAAVSADLKVSGDSGAYAGIWGSSGDAANGTEYDLYAGYGKQVGDLTLDASLWTYAYPESGTSPGELADLVLSVGYGPVTGTLYEAIEGDDDNEYRYYTLGYKKDKFSALYGQHDYETGDNPGHIQLGYQYNDNLSFAVSKFVKDTDAVEDDALFQATYSLDIK